MLKNFFSCVTLVLLIAAQPGLVSGMNSLSFSEDKKVVSIPSGSVLVVSVGGDTLLNSILHQDAIIWRNLDSTYSRKLYSENNYYYLDLQADPTQKISWWQNKVTKVNYLRYDLVTNANDGHLSLLFNHTGTGLSLEKDPVDQLSSLALSAVPLAMTYTQLASTTVGATAIKVLTLTAEGAVEWLTVTGATTGAALAEASVVFASCMTVPVTAAAGAAYVVWKLYQDRNMYIRGFRYIWSQAGWIAGQIAISTATYQMQKLLLAQEQNRQKLTDALGDALATAFMEWARGEIDAWQQGGGPNFNPKQKAALRWFVRIFGGTEVADLLEDGDLEGPFDTWQEGVEYLVGMFNSTEPTQEINLNGLSEIMSEETEREEGAIIAGYRAEDLMTMQEYFAKHQSDPKLTVQTTEAMVLMTSWCARMGVTLLGFAEYETDELLAPVAIVDAKNDDGAKRVMDQLETEFGFISDVHGCYVETLMLLGENYLRQSSDNTLEDFVEQRDDDGASVKLYVRTLLKSQRFKLEPAYTTSDQVPGYVQTSHRQTVKTHYRLSFTVGVSNDMLFDMFLQLKKAGYYVVIECANGKPGALYIALNQAGENAFIKGYKAVQRRIVSGIGAVPGLRNAVYTENGDYDVLRIQGRTPEDAERLHQSLQDLNILPFLYRFPRRSNAASFRFSVAGLFEFGKVIAPILNGSQPALQVPESDLRPAVVFTDSMTSRTRAFHLKKMLAAYLNISHADNDVRVKMSGSPNIFIRKSLDKIDLAIDYLTGLGFEVVRKADGAHPSVSDEVFQRLQIISMPNQADDGEYVVVPPVSTEQQVATPAVEEAISAQPNQIITIGAGALKLSIDLAKLSAADRSAVIDGLEAELVTPDQKAQLIKSLFMQLKTAGYELVRIGKDGTPQDVRLEGGRVIVDIVGDYDPTVERLVNDLVNE